MKRKRKMAENTIVLQSLGLDTSEPVTNVSKRKPTPVVRKAPQNQEQKRSSISITSGASQKRLGRSWSAAAGAVAAGAAAYQEPQHMGSSSAPAAADHQESSRKKRRARLIPKEHGFEVGQDVWARDPQYGDFWWPATVTVICPLQVKWEKPENCDPVYSPSDFTYVRPRMFCACGSCTADMLPDDRALDDHQDKVAACIGHASHTIRVEKFQTDANRWLPPRPPFHSNHLQLPSPPLFHFFSSFPSQAPHSLPVRRRSTLSPPPPSLGVPPSIILPPSGSLPPSVTLSPSAFPSLPSLPPSVSLRVPPSASSPP